MTEIALNKLKFGHEAPGASINSRASDREGDVIALAGNIASDGLIQALGVWEGPDKNHYVVDGNRRLAALRLLTKRGKLKDTMPIEVRLLRAATADEALSKSLSANLMHLPLHPVDQYEAFAKLAESGLSDANIAERFFGAESAAKGATAVKRVLALGGGLAPLIRAEWRAGNITRDGAEAFTVEPSNERQVAIYEAMKKKREAFTRWNVRSALLGQTHQTKRLVGFVGLDAYRKAGGAVTEDLFAGKDGEQYAINNPEILKRLADEKMAGERTRLLDAGWGSVKVGDEAGNVHMLDKVNGKAPKATTIVVLNLDAEGVLSVGYYAQPKGRAASAAGGQATAKKKKTGEVSNALAQRLEVQKWAAIKLALKAKPSGAMAALLSSLVAEQIDIEGGKYATTPQAIRTAEAALASKIDRGVMRKAFADAFDAEGYFSGIGRKGAEAALAAMGCKAKAPSKAADLVKLCVDEARRSRWLPPQLRTPAYNGPKEKRAKKRR